MSEIKKINCPYCNRKLDEQWGETGPLPDIKIYVRRCDHCGCLISHYELIKRAIKLNLKRLELLKEIHHSWPESIELVSKSLSLYGIESAICDELISQNLY